MCCVALETLCQRADVDKCDRHEGDRHQDGRKEGDDAPEERLGVNQDTVVHGSSGAGASLPISSARHACSAAANNAASRAREKHRPERLTLLSLCLSARDGWVRVPFSFAPEAAAEEEELLLGCI